MLHGDTTARLVYGEYKEGDEEEILNITWGYNKERRTDLKQFKVGLVTTREGFPIFGEIEDGNLDDKKWNKNLIENLAENIMPEILKDMVYVADSALVTSVNLSLIEKQKLKFISRLPNTFNLASELIEKAFASVVFIALLIYMVIQIRVRRALKGEKEPLELVGKVKSFEPTGARILELFEYVKILKIKENDKIKRYLPEKYIKGLSRVMFFLRIDFDIFTNPP